MSNPEIMWSKAFAWNATNKNTIQDERQSGQAEQDANLKDGFPLITMTPQDAGGIAPNGQDMNGIMYAISSDMVHRQKGLRIQFDPVYAAKIGGYDQGCILASNDYTRDYISLIPNNLTDPNGSGTAGRWAIYAGAGSVASATASIAGIVKIVDSLSSNATDAALTANQGRILSGRTQPATTTNVGITRFATATEVINRSAVNAAVTPNQIPMNDKLTTATGSAPSYSARAFANFNGSGSLLNGKNVSSITRLSVGSYRVNFSVAMPTINFAAIFSASGSGFTYETARTTNSVTFATKVDDGGSYDAPLLSIVIFS